MDKYVLVSQDQYDELIKRRKNQEYSRTESKESNVQVPPPGLPAQDELAKSGIELNEKEQAKYINETLQKALDDSKLTTVFDNSDSNKDNSGESESWRKFWKSASS